MVRSVAGDLPEQVKNNQSVNMAAGNGGQEISQYSWFTVYTNTMQVYFSQNKRFDFVHVGNFFEALNNILDEIDSELNYRNEIEAKMEAEYRAEMTAEQDHYW